MANATAPFVRRHAGALIAATVVLVGAIAGYVLLSRDSPAPSAVPPPKPVASALPAEVQPSFDVVRVAPSGEAVIAGRAAPGAEVSVTDNGRVVGQARADAAGNFVVIPAGPIPSGGHELGLVSRAADGTEKTAEQTVLLAVPERAAQPTTESQAGQGVRTEGADGTVALLAQPGAVSRLLQAPAADGQSKARAGSGQLGMDVVDYDQSGQIRLSGSAPPGASVRIYVDNTKVGDALADATGRWVLSPEMPIANGQHDLRVDQLAPTGQVTARVELPFQRDALGAGTPLPGRLVVQPGQNLWRIARTAYGRGIQYTVIYQANRAQIRAPDRIYPGQVFAMPAKAIRPVSSNKSR